jgi:aryl-alcohol dehydrogenase-like predicted oxidoreductase
MGVLTYSPLNSGWLSGHADIASSHRASMLPTRYDPSSPTGRLKVEALTALLALADEAGVTLPTLATAFVRAHPGVTAVLIGPRTREQLDGLLAGVDVRLSDDVLDRIDAIVAPGVDLDPADNYAAEPPALLDARLRRR